MENREDINIFLESNAFKLIDRNESESFGDCFYTYANDLIKLRFVSDKSFKSIDITNNNDNKNWYDLALLKALIYQEQNLNLVTSIEELIIFLNKEINYINQLFDKDNLRKTNNALEKLRNIRMKQMFPNV